LGWDVLLDLEPDLDLELDLDLPPFPFFVEHFLALALDLLFLLGTLPVSACTGFTSALQIVSFISSLHATKPLLVNTISAAFLGTNFRFAASQTYVMF
jgi:hypothetical protein